MADNVGYTPGVGATIAADDIGGILYQKVKMIHGADGIAHETADNNPLPVTATQELMQAIEAMRMAIQALTRTIGLAQVNPLTGSMFVDGSRVTQPVSGTVSVGTPAVTQSGTWNITNLATIGGQAANSAIPAFERNTADNLRRNINVT
ncbi:MAG: hypothetical protein ACK5A2_08775 [Bacteroidota bacterium]|jgi:hypothetical protein